jgi:hypothetical protein
MNATDFINWSIFLVESALKLTEGVSTSSSRSDISEKLSVLNDSNPFFFFLLSLALLAGDSFLGLFSGLSEG